MSFKLDNKALARLNVKRVFNKLIKELKDNKDAFKVIIKYSAEKTLDIKLDENLQYACTQANMMLKEAANSDSFHFEEFGFEAKNMAGIDKINITCFIIAQYMFSENPIFNDCQIIIRMAARTIQHEFKWRLLSYIYNLACYRITNPSKNTQFDWKWEKENDAIYVYAYEWKHHGEIDIVSKIPYSTKMVSFKIDNDVLHELASVKLCDIPRNMIVGDYDYEKYFNYAKIYHESIFPEKKVRAIRTFYIILIHLKLDLPTYKGYLPAKIIEHIMSFVSIQVGVVLE